jgi:hypothetical protein
MKSPPRLLFLPVAAVCVTLACAAEARPVDCSAEGQAGAARCLVATERVQSGRDPLSAGAIRPQLGVSVSAQAPVSEPARNDDPPFLALLLATVGIVAFMAHRRTGG